MIALNIELIYSNRQKRFTLWLFIDFNKFNPLLKRVLKLKNCLKYAIFRFTMFFNIKMNLYFFLGVIINDYKID